MFDLLENTELKHTLINKAFKIKLQYEKSRQQAVGFFSLNRIICSQSSCFLPTR